MAEQFIFFGDSAATLGALVGANQTYWAATGGANYPSNTSSPFTSGYGKDSGSSWSGADRSSSGIAAYLAGIIYNGGTNAGFQVAIPNGDYIVRLAMGDRLAARSGMSWVLRDGGSSGTVLHSVGSASTSAADNFVDINGTNHTAANYPSNKTSVTVTVAAGSVYIEVGANGFWNYISFESASDTTAPVLTSPVGTTTGSTTATIGATTDEGNGTLYGVVTTSNTQPSVAQIAAGQDHTGSAAAFGGSVAVSSTGAKTINATGLTPSTAYYAHLYHDDAAGNDSNRVTSSQFTTDAAGGSGGGPLTRGLTRSPLIKGRCLA